nr:MAG TPA: minor tail protein [Caudoviricetes sp.]
MAKQLNVNLSMTANTSAAVAQLKQLQQQLTNLMNSTTNVNNSSFGITKEIQEATEAAAQLKVQLQAATDSTTGKLDLSKFNQELHKSGMTLEQYQDKLSALGPEGERAFAQVTESIVNADAKIRDANSVLAQFATTLKNAARWQISSSVLHGFMGSLQSAYGYAKDLNSSLNDIQIVTGNSTEKMAAFAEQANKAAKSLSTTTTTYTDAALIFYQQGLDDEAVLDRTNTVIKLANVTKDSAEDVSSYMTAIWENFYDGSKSLEYYADVITRLGADTAASSAEIAEGLESFASIGDTIGLSYEYATSALTTIVAKTRASASEVGNGLRTIFSRLQNLSLGETLEDGTDLTKYTKALATVGVSIKDTSGELKSMDDILDDLASKWGTLDQAEKTALANTVGGVRQYTKLIALMDNWDFMKQNIQRAKSSEGSLQEQADIYEESWEAARKKVKAALEDIYATLIDDKFFIKLNNGFADFLGLISKTVKGLGGLQGVLINLGAIIAKVYQKDIARSMSNFGLSIMSMTKTGRKKIEELRTNAIEQSSKRAVDDGSISGMAMSNSLSARGQALQSFYDASKDLSQVHKEIAQNLLDEQKALTDNVAKRAEELKIAQQIADETEREFLVTQGDKKGAIDYYNTTAKKEARQAGVKNFLKDTLDKEVSNFDDLMSKSKKSESVVKDSSSRINTSLKEMQKGFSKLGITMEEALGEAGAASFQQLLDCFDENGQIIESKMKEFRTAWTAIITDNADAKGISNYQKVLDKLAQSISGLSEEKFKEIAEAMRSTGNTANFAKDDIDAYNNAVQRAEGVMRDNRALGGQIAQTAQSQSFLSNATEAFTEKMAQMKKDNISGADAFEMLGNAAMSTVAAIQNVINVMKNWSDMDIGSKITAVTTTILTAVSALSQVGSVIANWPEIITAIERAASAAAGAIASAITAIATAIGVTVPVLLAIVGIVAAVTTAIGFGIKYLYDNSAEGRLKKAEKDLKAVKEQAAKSQEEFSKARQEVESLKSAFDSYNEVVDKLNSCTVGTQEWSDALNEVNDKVTELLEKYPELLQLQGLYENGTLNPDILKEGLQKLLGKKDAETLQLGAISTMDKASVAQQDLEVAKRKFESEHGNFVDPKANKQIFHNFDEDLEKLLNSYQKIGDSTLDLTDAYAVLDIKENEVSDEAKKLVNSFFELAQQAINVSNIMDNAALSIINNWANLNDQDFEKGQAQLMKNAYEVAYKDAEERVKAASDQNAKQGRKDDSSGIFFGEKMSVTEAFKRATGIDYKLASNGVRGTDNNRTYVFKDENDKEVPYTLKQMQTAIAAAEALEKMGAMADEAATALNNLDKNAGKEIGAGIRDWLVSGNFESMTQADFNKMITDLDKNADGNYTQEEAEGYLKDKTEVTNVGEDFGEDWYTRFNSAAKNFETALNGLTNHMSVTAEGIYNSIQGRNNMTVASQKNLANTVQSAFNANGSEGANALVDQINAALKEGASQDDISALTEVLTSTDWDTASIADFKDALSKAGLDAKKLGINVKTIFDAMSTGAATDLTNVQKTYKSIHDIIKDLATGDTINDEEYNKLSSQIGTEAMDGFFSTMADGTHQLIGDAKEFYDVVTENSRQTMLNNISNANNLSGSLEKTSAAEMNGGGFVSPETLDAEVAYLQTLELTEEETNKLAEIQNAYNQTGSYSTQMLFALNDLMANHQITEEQFGNLVEQNNNILKENSESLLSTATSLEDFYDLLSQITDETDGSVLYSSIASGLINLASKYDNCSKEVIAYQNALQIGNTEQIKAAETALQCSIRAGELGEEFNLSADSIERYAKEMKESGKYSQANDAELIELAKDQLRYDRAVKSAIDNLEDWKKALAEATKSGHLDAESAQEMAEAYGDMLDLDGSNLSNSFLKSAKNLELMEDAMNGNEEAYQQLLDAAHEDLNIQFGISPEQQAAFQSAIDNVVGELYHVKSLGDIEVGATLDDQNFLNELTNLVNKAGLTADQATDYLSSMGVDAEVVEDHSQMQQNSTYMGAKATVTHETGTASLPLFGAPLHWDIPSVKYEPQEVPTTATVEGGGFSLKVKSAKKSSGGNIKHINSNAGTPASSKKGGGGGGGSAKPQTKNSEKHITKAKEEDRYHVIKNQIEDLSAQYDRIGKAKDKAFGPNRIKLLDQEIAKQKELTAANKKYLEEVEQYQELDKSKMVSYGATFDKNGTITNYDKLLEEQVRLYNEAVDKFNEAYTDDEGAKAAFEAAKERYEQFKEDLDKYEESQDLYKDQLQAIIDAENQERALRLEKTQAEVELKVNVSEDSIEYLDYALNNIENKAYDVANAFALLDKKTATYFEKSKAYVDGLKSLFANQGLTDDDFNKLLTGDVSAFEKIKSMLSNGENAGFTSDDIDAIRDYVKELISTNEELQEVRQTVHDQLLTVWDEWNDKMDTAISKIEHLQNITSSYKNIIDIVGQKSLGLTDSFMSDLSQKTIDQANNKLQAEKARYDSLKKSRDEVFAKYENQKNSGILSEEEVKMWEDNLKQMDDDVQSAAENFQSAWEDALNAANEEFENSVQRIIDAYSDAAAGLMGSMSELQEAFDRGTDLSDQYLDDYEKIYQFSKLNKDIQESIDSTDSVKAKKELLALQSKINAYEESGAEISEYQMDYLRKEYELKKAQIDLEESQNAKSQVKMQRDNEGNYSYVYTANDDDVAKAEQNYEDKLHEMQVANADYIKELQGNMVQMEQDYQDKVQEIMTDTSLTAEERMVKLNEVNEYYDEKMKYYISEAQVWQDNSSRLYDQDWKNYSEMTGYKISAADQWIDKWKETQLAMLTGFSSLEEYQQNHDTNVANLLLSAGSAFSTWQTNIETAMNSAGTSIGTFGDDATETLKAISEASKETKDSVVDMAESAEEAINGVTEAITNWEDAYSKVLKETLAGNEQLINSFNELLRAWSGVSSLPDTTPESKKVSTQSAPIPKTSSFDTGGYTGSWGADGKFALLHEKELILNAEDTKNFLTAIDTVRQISDMIDLNALSSSGGLTSLFAAKASTSDRTLQQEVTIHAEFPNVEDKDQISAAFNDLVNLASQYANRK